jgi:hypothetical protein
VGNPFTYFMVATGSTSKAMLRPRQSISHNQIRYAFWSKLQLFSCMKLARPVFDSDLELD